MAFPRERNTVKWCERPKRHLLSFPWFARANLARWLAADTCPPTFWRPYRSHLGWDLAKATILLFDGSRWSFEGGWLGIRVAASRCIDLAFQATKLLVENILVKSPVIFISTQKWPLLPIGSWVFSLNRLIRLRDMRILFLVLTRSVNRIGILR